jgi:hypothetical protein
VAVEVKDEQDEGDEQRGVVGQRVGEVGKEAEECDVGVGSEGVVVSTVLVVNGVSGSARSPS